MTLEEQSTLLDKLTSAATRLPRCCDRWQDGLGGMHCRECGQKTFRMMWDIQQLLGVDKSGKRPEPTSSEAIADDPNHPAWDVIADRALADIEGGA